MTPAEERDIYKSQLEALQRAMWSILSNGWYGKREAAPLDLSHMSPSEARAALGLDTISEEAVT